MISLVFEIRRFLSVNISFHIGTGYFSFYVFILEHFYKWFFRGTTNQIKSNLYLNNLLQIDVWAAGVILYILLCGFPPFVAPDGNQDALFDAILSGRYDFPRPYWAGVSRGARDLIANMLQHSPHLRFGAEDVLDHPWLSGTYIVSLIYIIYKTDY